MSTAKTIAGMIGKSRGVEAAERYLAFAPDEADKQVLVETGRKLLDIFPAMPGGCLMMSALYACPLQATIKAPIYVVAGSLSVGRVRVFGDDRPVDGERRFSQSNLSWDGHAWMLFGSYIVDASIFRTAYSAKSPPLLASHVLREFGLGRGVLIDNIEEVAKCGLNYTPQYVLSEDQITSLARGAMEIIETKARSGRCTRPTVERRDRSGSDRP